MNNSWVLRVRSLLVWKLTFWQLFRWRLPTLLTFNLPLSRFCFVTLKFWGQRCFTIMRMNNAIITQKCVQTFSITHFIWGIDTVTYSVEFHIKRLRVDIVHTYIIAGVYIIMALFTKGHVIVHHSPRTGDLSQISFCWQAETFSIGLGLR